MSMMLGLSPAPAGRTTILQRTRHTAAIKRAAMKKSFINYLPSLILQEVLVSVSY
jgi:hypothetical protein